MKKSFLLLIAAVLTMTFFIGAFAAGDLSCFPADAKVSLSAQDVQEMDDLLIDYAAFRSASFTGERTMMAGDHRFSEMAAEEADRSVKIREKNGKGTLEIAFYNQEDLKNIALKFEE